MDTRSVIELVLLGAIWGASFMFSRVAVPAFGPFAMVAVRVGIAAVVLGAVLARRRVDWPVRELWRPIVVVGALNTAIPFTLFAYATLTLTAGYAAVLNATVPLFGVLVSWLWTRAVPRPRQLGGLFLGLLGVVFLVAGDLTATVDIKAVTAGLMASLFYAFAAYYTRERLTGVPPLAIAAGSQVAAAVLILPLAFLFHPTTNPPAISWSAAVALGVVCTGLAYLLYFRLIARVGPGPAVTVTYLIPVFGMMWGALLLDEPITRSGVVACLVILLGVAVATRRRPGTVARPTHLIEEPAQ